MKKILRTINDLPDAGVRELYDEFNAPITALDCGRMCAPHNPSGKPFCCDICHAVPAAYRREWEYLEPNTDLWHAWRGDECDASRPRDERQIRQVLPDGMVLLACLGPEHCQRDFRALSCRQFPFFPYVTSDYRFLGLAYEWEFVDQCWVISNLERITPGYREEFVRLHDRLFALFQPQFDAYARHSARMREHYRQAGRRFPLLHRNGHAYLVSPASEGLAPIELKDLPKFGPYRA